MPMKIQKTDSNRQLVVERIHHAKSYSLNINRDLCVGCEVCSLICPREAIAVNKNSETTGEKTQRPIIDVDESKCHFCGICAALCPCGAVQVELNHETFASAVEKESFPQLIREISVDATKCPLDCKICEEACPLNLIKVTSDKASGNVTVDVKREQCPCCRVCEIKCPEDAIRVRKIFTGKLKINQEKCPSECQKCLDVCPITGALSLESDGKVYANELFCIYCGACKNVCPEESALELSRSTILHTPVRSGAWNKALEKLASTVEMAKELRGKGRKRAMDAVKKRLEPSRK